MDITCKLALLHAAQQRMRRANYGYTPPITRPTITRRHIDGPYLSTLDGQLFWLSPWERLLTKLGIWDAWDIEWRKCPLPASAMSARSDETPQAAQSEGRQRGGEAETPNG